MSVRKDEVRELHKAATQGDLTTAERHIKCETVECPACQGDGELDAADYCNFDGVALGVQFYGIGGHFGAHEALWRYLVQSLPAILAMAEREKRMREALDWALNEIRSTTRYDNEQQFWNCYDLAQKALGEEKA